MTPQAQNADPNAQVNPQVQVPPVPQPDPAVLRMQQELTRTRADMDRLRSQIMAPPQQQQQQAQQPDIRELNRQFNANPVEMTAAIAQRAAAEAVNSAQQQNAPNLETLATIAREQARNTDPVLFDRFAAEIEANVANVSPQFRTNINVWQNAFRMVKGSHIDEILAERGQTPPAERPHGPAVHISQGAGPAPPSKAAPVSNNQEPLTELEKRTAKKFHITEDQYRKGKAENLAQSDIILDPIGKSSWDDYVTFDSKEKRRKQRAAATAAKK